MTIIVTNKEGSKKQKYSGPFETKRGAERSLIQRGWKKRRSVFYKMVGPMSIIYRAKVVQVKRLFW